MTSGMEHSPRSVVKSAALGFVAVASPALVAVFLAGGGAPLWLVGVLLAGLPLALTAAALVRPDGSMGGAGPYLVAMASVLAAGVCGAALSSPEPVLLGLPRGALWMIGGIWLLPLVLASWSYTRTFPSAMLDAARLERMRSSRKR